MEQPTGAEDPHAELPSDPDVLAASPGRPLHLRPSSLAWVFAGGVVGTALRYVIENALPHGPSGWPWATFLINLSGAFVLGGLLEGLARLGDDSGWRQRARLCAGTGGCGAFTTYSTFALEAVLLDRHGHLGTAIGYGLVSVVAGVVTAWLGIVIAAGVHGRTVRP
ncbi:MAG: crcB protein [Mycobacterium sp.]|jgi:CrcB protein|nr:crcB protein [Mycobacterium sp.]MDT5064568.1 fluoride exporter [Mycobacterium sp.]MDT5178326.1 fluoride exporter [Mycobacterium sp.]